MGNEIGRNTKESNKWGEVKNYFGDRPITLGPFTGYRLRNTPRNVLFGLSRYKFAAKMLGDGKEVLEVGCSEGLGTILLAEFAKRVVAVDMDEKAIGYARESFPSEKIEFKALDFLEADLGRFDSVVSFDVIEHIYPENERKFFSAIARHLKKDGICIIGTPNKNAEQYASEITRLGHVNTSTWQVLKDNLKSYFRDSLIFSSNDEIVHTGFYPLAHYLIGMGVGVKGV